MEIEKRYSQEAILFGKQVRKIRKSRDLTQPVLSTMALITQPEISLIENGCSNIVFHTLIKLASGLRIRTLDFFDYKNTGPFAKLKAITVEKRFAKERVYFGKRIEQLLKNDGIIQDDFAVSVDFDSGDLSRFINGDHNIEFINIVKIAEGLNVELINLFEYNKIVN